MAETVDLARHRVASLQLGVVAVPTLVLGIVGVLVGLVWWGLIVGFVVGAALLVWARVRVAHIVLASVGARPATEAEFRRYHNLVEGLCVTSGVPKPALWVIDDAAANAMAVARAPQEAALVITRGLLEQLPRIEQEGVVASLLGQIRSGDAMAGCMVAALVSPLAPVGKAAATLAQRFVEPGRHTRHDVTACRITRYPPGLIAAFERLTHHDTRPRLSPAAVAHLWLIPPSAAAHTPTLDERIAMLREL